MRQVVLSRRTGRLRLAEVPAPACRRGGVLVRTRCSVVSTGTERQVLALAGKSLLGKARARPDLVAQVLDKARAEGVASAVARARAKLDATVALGYSAAGDVVEADREAHGLAVGDRVAAGGGGYATHAEFNVVPRNLCVKIPEAVSYADGAFAAVGAIALQGVRRAQPLIGERVAVVGLGLIGLLTVQILKANGCAVLGVDVDERRLAAAEALGADAAAVAGAARACRGFTAGCGADAVIVTAATPSSEPVVSAAAMSRPRGRVVVVGAVGMDVPREVFYRKELDLRLSMSYGPGRYDPAYEEGGQDYPLAHVRFTEQRNLESFLYLVQQGRVTPSALVTHRLPFDDALDAYALLEARATAADAAGAGHLGILLEYPPGAAAERTVAHAATAVAGPRRDEVAVGVIGAGSFAQGVLLPHLVREAGVRLAGICSRTGRAADDAARRFRCGLATTDPARLLDDAGVGAVIIATRHASHAALAAAALRSGKHVFVEKPLCLSDAELDDVERALQEARDMGGDPCLMVGFNRRFAPHARAIDAAFQDRGTPLVVSYRVNAGAVAADSWLADPAEGGRIIGEGCHFADFCNALTGSQPVSVTAHGVGAGRKDAGGDSVVMTIQYADGSLATIQYVAAGNRRLPKERCEVFADGRAAVLDDFRTTRFYGGGRSVRGRQAKGFAEELRAFVEVCRSGGPWPISWADMVVAHRICFAAVRSLETRATVQLQGTAALEQARA